MRALPRSNGDANATAPVASRGDGLLVRLGCWSDRWLQVLRYHRSEQLIRRAYRRFAGPCVEIGARCVRPLRHPWVRHRVVPPPPVRDLRTRRTIPASANPGFCRTTAGADCASGAFELLNLRANLGSEIDWKLRPRPDAPPLWAFHLHYHEFLLAAASEPTGSDWRSIWGVVESWLAEFAGHGRIRDRVAWSPYCISRRLPVWMHLFRAEPPEQALAESLLDSMALQTAFLARNLERDLGGNHLWENAKALATAGCFFAGPAADRWRSMGLDLLDRCIDEQLLPHGEQFERSPMYQADLARGLTDLSGWLRPVDPDAADRNERVAARMTTFLDAIRHPDGLIPLFGDATHDADASVCPPHGNSSGWVGDYYVHRRGSDALLFDAGDVGPDDLPAHAHADLLGFELSLHGRRALVDSGTFSYTGPRRSEFRGSKAHNVLTIDGVDSADVWSSFRMGRRGHIVERSSGSRDGGYWIRARHDAYARLGIEGVERWWFLADDGPWFAVHLVSGDPRRSHVMTERLHWHPDATMTFLDPKTAEAALDGPILWELATAESATAAPVLRVGQGAYSTHFHRARSNTTFKLELVTAPPAVLAWTISTTTEPVRPTIRLEPDRLVLNWRSGNARRHAYLPLGRRISERRSGR